MLRNCFWHPFTLHDTNRTMISHFRFWLTVHWLVFHDNNTQSATCIWPSSSLNSHSRHQRASWRKLSRTLSWRTNGARLCGQNVQRPRDSWVTLFRVFVSWNLNQYFISAIELDRLRTLQAPPRQALQEPNDWTRLREIEANSLQERNTLRQAHQGNETFASKETKSCQEEEGRKEEACW